MSIEERLARLEIRLENLQASHDIIGRQLAQAHVVQWQGRLDDLELKVHLGRPT